MKTSNMSRPSEHTVQKKESWFYIAAGVKKVQLIETPSCHIWQRQENIQLILLSKQPARFYKIKVKRMNVELILILKGKW